MARKKSTETEAAALAATEESIIKALSEDEAYSYDKETGEYKGIVQRQRNPREGGYFMPAHSTLVSPENVTAGEHEAVCWDKDAGEWTLKADYRGTTWYDTATKAQHEIKELGVTPEETWTDKAPGEYQEWNAETDTWETPPEVEEELERQAAQAKARQIIQEKLMLQAAQTLDFTTDEFATMALAGDIFPEWEAGTEYSAGARVAHTTSAAASLDTRSSVRTAAKTVIYQVAADITASEDNPPHIDSEDYIAISETEA